MKIIVIEEKKGGDSFVRIFSSERVILEEERPEIGFYSDKDIERRLVLEEVTECRMQPLERRRNVMRYLSKLFMRMKNGKDSNTR